jgi:hypothetical protein
MINISNCPKNPPAKFFEPDGTLITETDDERIFYYIRGCIRKGQLTGYYIEFNGERISLDRNGTPSKYPNGMFDVNTLLLLELV